MLQHEMKSAGSDRTAAAQVKLSRFDLAVLLEYNFI